MNAQNVDTNGHKPTFISTFAGCGGSSLGYKWAGFQELLAIEWDSNAVETFKLNFDCPVWQRDIRKVTAKEILDFTGLQKGELGLLDGSPPCQGFSMAGKRQVLDNRNDLFKEFVRLIDGLQPKIFVMENVSGMIKGKMKGRFIEIMQALKALNYNVRAKLMNAMYYGVPQSRQRLIFIGIHDDLNIKPNFPLKSNYLISVKKVINNLGNIQKPKINHIWIDESPSGRNTKTFNSALRARQGQKYAGMQIRIKANKPAPTLCKPSSDEMNIKSYLRNSHCHYKFTRTLSIREMARIATFPDDFRFRQDGASKIGNSVPPKFMQAIAGNIKNQVFI